MRLSSLLISQRGISDMQRIGAEVAQTQEQIASGRRVVRASDDPVGASKIVALRREIAARETYVQNTEVVETRLSEEENVLAQMIDVVQRVQELVLQASNGTLTKADREFIAAEIESRQVELSELMNARGADGKFLFSGSKGDTRPFVIDGRDVRYQGDEQQRQLQVDSGLYVPFSDSGRALFMDIPASAPTFQVEASPHNQAADIGIRALGVVDAEALSEFAPQDLIIEFQPLADAGGEANFTIRRLSDDRVVGPPNQLFVPGVPIISQGMQFSIDGIPETGDRFVVRSTHTQSVLETVGNVASDLVRIDDRTSPEAFRTMADNAIADLNLAQDNILRARAEIGARLNTVSATRDFHEEQNLSTETLISAVRDLDYAEAVSRLTFQSFVLEAAQQSFVRVSRLSLFNAL